MGRTSCADVRPWSVERKGYNRSMTMLAVQPVRPVAMMTVMTLAKVQVNAGAIPAAMPTAAAMAVALTEPPVAMAPAAPMHVRGGAGRCIKAWR